MTARGWLAVLGVALLIGACALSQGQPPAPPTFPAPAVEATPTADPRVPELPTDPLFDTCAEAADAGYGPYGTADPEYAAYDDRDGDGVVCERG